MTFSVGLFSAIRPTGGCTSSVRRVILFDAKVAIAAPSSRNKSAHQDGSALLKRSPSLCASLVRGPLDSQIDRRLSHVANRLQRITPSFFFHDPLVLDAAGVEQQLLASPPRHEPHQL